MKHILIFFKKYEIIACRGVCLPKSNNVFNLIAKHYYLGDKSFPIFADLEGNTSYYSDIFYQAGGWDNQIEFGGGQGVDLSIRLLEIEKDFRKQIYSPEPVIFHDFVRDENHLNQKLERQEKSRQRLKLKHLNWDKSLKAGKIIAKERICL